MELRVIHNDKVEVVLPFCPSCFMRIESEYVEIEMGVFIHTHPFCVSKWSELSPKVRRRRVIESDRLNSADWLSELTQEGYYWARLKGGSALRNLYVVLDSGRLFVSVGGKFHPISSYSAYEFLPKAA